jgi:hypothetical protein
LEKGRKARRNVEGNLKEQKRRSEKDFEGAIFKTQQGQTRWIFCQEKHAHIFIHYMLGWSVGVGVVAVEVYYRGEGVTLLMVVMVVKLVGMMVLVVVGWGWGWWLIMVVVASNVGGGNKCCEI